MAWLGEEGEGAGPLAGLWQALLAALAAAFMAWLWYGGGGGGNQEEAAAVAAGPEPEESKRETAGAEEPFQSSGCVLPEMTAEVLRPPENQWIPPREHCIPSVPMEPSEIEPVVKQSAAPLMNYAGFLKSDTLGHLNTISQALLSREVERPGKCPSPEVGGPGNVPKEELHHKAVDQEEWETVPDHSAWGEALRKSNVDEASSRNLEQAKRIVAVSPMPQSVHVVFRVHYHTHSEAQLIAIMGDHECLGQWHRFVPLRYDKDGFWLDSVVLPADTSVEWKFVLVENGKVVRWEECGNRTLMTEREDQVAHKWWGYH